MIGDVVALSVPDVSLANGHYPLFSSIESAISLYGVQTFEDATFTRDLDQVVKLPVFDDYETVNMFVLDDRLYWVVSYVTLTKNVNVVAFNLSYCAPSDNIHVGDSIEMYCERVPYHLSTACRDIPFDDELELNMEYPLTTFEDLFETATGQDFHDVYQIDSAHVVWVEIATHQVYTPITGDSESKCTLTSNSGLRRYGFFSVISRDTIVSQIIRACPSGSSTYYVFPDVLDVIENPESYGFSTSDIVGINVSYVCPWEIDNITYSNNIIGVSLSSDVLGVACSNANLILIPDTAGTTYHPFYVAEQTYHLTGSSSSSNYCRLAPMSDRSLSVGVNEDMQLSGDVVITGIGRVEMAHIPTEYTDMTTDTIGIDYRAVSDYGGIDIVFEVQDDHNQIITVPTAKLPYVGDAWEEYRIREQATDRQARQYALDNSIQDGIFNVAISGANATAGMVAGGVSAENQLSAGMTTGTSIAGALYNTYQVARSNDQTAKLTEHRLKDSAGIGYLSGHGLKEMYDMISYPIAAWVKYPVHYNMNEYGAYRDEFGYPAQGLRTLNVAAGYWRGRIIPSAPGMMTDRMVDIFAGGFKFIVRIS